MENRVLLEKSINKKYTEFLILKEFLLKFLFDCKFPYKKNKIA